MKYLHYYDTKTAHDAVYNGNGYEEPWVAYVEDSQLVTYNLPHNYRRDYFTIEALETGDITITIHKNVTSAEATSISYSKDKSNWTDTNISNVKQVITIPVNANDHIYLKGTAKLWAKNVNYCTTINSTVSINVSGNTMSLFYGDNFKGATIFPSDSSYNLACLFNNNKNLRDVNNLILPAISLNERCYSAMFYGCSSLISAPKLSATTLADSCYSNMFRDCTSLTDAPELPATTLTNYCYNYMFYNCTSLTSAPELPATTLANNCYSYMFAECTGLTNTPEFPATTLALSCYYATFSGTDVLPDCSNIDFTQHNNGGLSGLFFGTNVTDSDLMNILPINLNINKYWLPATTLTDSCYKSMFYNCRYLNTPPELPAIILNLECYSLMFYGCSRLTSTPKLPATTLANYCYQQMFSGCSSLTSAPELPATTLALYCYLYMFRSCTDLTTAPELPATILVDSCYEYMFQSCTSLTTPPELPATTLAKGCYHAMFSGCTSLTLAPELPAMTLALSCYNEMFSGCTSLTTSPELLATTLMSYAYTSMFFSCSKLNKITMLAVNNISTNFLSNWVKYVSSTGTFIKAPSATLPTGDSGIPSGWTVVDYTSN